MKPLLACALVVVVALASTAAGCSKRRTPQPLGVASSTASASASVADPQDTWSLAKGDVEGRPLIMRVRTSIAKIPDPTKPVRLTVRWDYGTAGADGLPDDAAIEAMDRFEDRLVPALERSGLALVVAVATTSGAREWIFYVSDVSECEKRFNATFAKDDPPLPVKLTSIDDASWSELEGIVDQLAH